MKYKEFLKVKDQYEFLRSLVKQLREAKEEVMAVFLKHYRYIGGRESSCSIFREFDQKIEDEISALKKEREELEV